MYIYLSIDTVAGKPGTALRAARPERGGGWDGVSFEEASAGGGGSQMVEGAKRRGATAIFGGAVAVAVLESCARNARAEVKRSRSER